jgi:hypothetical protein
VTSANAEHNREIPGHIFMLVYYTLFTIIFAVSAIYLVENKYCAARLTEGTIILSPRKCDYNDIEYTQF